jgi:hypothetical protein
MTKRKKHSGNINFSKNFVARSKFWLLMLMSMYLDPDPLPEAGSGSMGQIECASGFPNPVSRLRIFIDRWSFVVAQYSLKLSARFLTPEESSRMASCLRSAAQYLLNRYFAWAVLGGQGEGPPKQNLPGAYRYSPTLSSPESCFCHSFSSCRK